MLVGLVKDESAQFDGYNWHDEYKEHFGTLGIETAFLDFKRQDWLKQVKVRDYDCFLWRAWHVPWDKEDARSKIFFLENVLGKNIFPTWSMYWAYDDKAAQLYLLQKFGVPHPGTFFTRDRVEAENFAQECRLPIISKSVDGACGDNVRLYTERNSLVDHVKQVFTRGGVPTYFPGRHQQMYIYLQEYVSIKRDLRIITIGEKVELAFWRESEAWIKNVSQGGKINPDRIPAEALELSKKISKALGMHWCAYDMIESSGRILVLEFSSMFGFSGREYEKTFGNKNGFILRKQAEYIKKFLETKYG